MDGQTEAPGATPTASWLAEQEAKQAAYAARRRAWTLRLKRRALSDEDEADELAVPSVAAGDGAPPRCGRPRHPAATGARHGARPAAVAVRVLSFCRLSRRTRRHAIEPASVTPAAVREPERTLVHPAGGA